MFKYLKANALLTDPLDPNPYSLLTPLPSPPLPPPPSPTPIVSTYQYHFSPSLYATNYMCI